MTSERAVSIGRLQLGSAVSRKDRTDLSKIVLLAAADSKDTTYIHSQSVSNNTALSPGIERVKLM